MTSPAPSGGRSPLRIGGFALVAVAVIAAIVGLFGLMTGGQPTNPLDSSPTTAAGTPTTSAVAAPPSTVGPQPPAVATTPPAAPTAAPTSPIPSDTSPLIAAAPPTDAGLPGAGANSSARSPLHVYNNSLIPHLADRAAGDFRTGGWTVNDVGNYSSANNIPTSTVFYRSDGGEQAAAEALASQFGLQAKPRFNGLSSATDGLIVIVTKDYAGK